MPRGVQKSIEDRIAAVQSEIDELTARRNNVQKKIDDLEVKKQSLLDEHEQEKIKEIQKIIATSGKTPDEVLKMLQGA
jgi:prefoldin subunit 5